MMLLGNPPTGDQANHADAVRRLHAALDDQERLRVENNAARGAKNKRRAGFELSAANEQVAVRRAWLSYIDHGPGIQREQRAALENRVQELQQAGELAVRHADAEAVDQRDRLAAVSKLALTDELTRLPNRRAFDQQLSRELARAARHRSDVCAVMLDVDHFKEFNDQHGHRAGDLLLTELAAAWRVQLRGSDFVARSQLIARYGGEEFVIALSDSDQDEALAVVERLRAVVPAGQACSAGIAHWDGSETATELLIRADQALYQAKRAGRDQTALATEPPTDNLAHAEPG